MPHQTALAFRDHGVVKPSVDIGIDEAKRVIKDLSALGIDVSKVCEDLQKEGVKAFVDSFNSLISSIAKKVNSLDDKS
jgi:transaldolase/glucose-6-phosphate isomerase